MQLINVLAIALSLALAFSGRPVEASTAVTNSPVTQILVKKAERKLFLLSRQRVLRSYEIDLGFNPIGHKKALGDGRTPEGLYYITHRNPHSAYHLSLGISYPNEKDLTRARARGQDPGGSIVIHGRGPRYPNPKQDWTAGCIAVSDVQMNEIYRYARPGTPIMIMP